MASSFIYWTSDGGGTDDGGIRVRELHNWIMQQGDADLIVYGGDIYQGGTTQDFAQFFAQMGGNVSLMCETAGNHDWVQSASQPGIGQIPTGYEAFWSSNPFSQGDSQQPIDASKKSGARYEHCRDLNGWRLIFLDTGQCGGRCENAVKWPFSEASQIDWLKGKALNVQGQSKILFAHHSRLSWGIHGDNPGLQDLWNLLFDAGGSPLVAFTLSGHDHNVSVYKPRNRSLQVPADSKAGIQIFVNGAGGSGYYARSNGTQPDIYPKSTHPQDDPTTYCVTRIELIDAANAKISILGFGPNPSSVTGPNATLYQNTYSFG